MNQEEFEAFERSSDDGKMHTVLQGLKEAKGFMAFTVDKNGGMSSVGNGKDLSMAEMMGLQAFAVAFIKMKEIQMLTQGSFPPPDLDLPA